MKRIVQLSLIGLTLLTIASCGTSTRITGSWKKPQANTAFKSVFVSALTTNVPAKSAIENGLQNMLEPRLKVYKSMDAFPPDFESTNTKNPKAMLDKIRTTTNADVIMTVALVNKETEERYVPGTMAYDPLLRFGYYGRYSLYWGYRAPLYYDPGYYVTDKIYYLETNLYDAKTEDLIWSAQSATYNPASINSFLRGYLKSIEKKMKDDGVLSKQNGPV